MTTYSGVHLVVLAALREPACDLEDAISRTSLEKNTFCEAFDQLASHGLIYVDEECRVSLTEAGEAVLKGVSK
jgi:hypothetical protein